MQRQIDIQDELKKLYADVTKDNSKRIKQLNDENAQLNSNIEGYKQQAMTFKKSVQENNAEMQQMNTASYYKGQMQEWSNTITEMQKKANDAMNKGNNEELDYYNQQIKQASA